MCFYIQLGENWMLDVWRKEPVAREKTWFLLFSDDFRLGNSEFTGSPICMGKVNTF